MSLIIEHFLDYYSFKNLYLSRKFTIKYCQQTDVQQTINWRVSESFLDICKRLKTVILLCDVIQINPIKSNRIV